MQKQRLLPIIFRFIALGLISVFALSACSNFGFPGVYRIQIQQGNIVDVDDVGELRVGMSKSQVRYLLGTPLINDSFQQNRWDYFYSLRNSEGDTKQKRVTLKFTGDLLDDIEKSGVVEKTATEGS